MCVCVCVSECDTNAVLGITALTLKTSLMLENGLTCTVIHCTLYIEVLRAR